MTLAECRAAMAARSDGRFVSIRFLLREGDGIDTVLEWTLYSARANRLVSAATLGEAFAKWCAAEDSARPDPAIEAASAALGSL